MPAGPSGDHPSQSNRIASAVPGPHRSRLLAQAPARPLWRQRVTRAVAAAACHAYTGYRVEGQDLIPAGPAVLVFTHQNWIDPVYLIAILPTRPRCRFFGPEQEDMTHGFRNRVMHWSGIAVPFRPGRRGLIAATELAEELLRGGGRIGIAGEGRIHSGERVVLPLLEGPAYLAVRAGVPLVPVAVNGTSWLAFRKGVRVRFGRPIVAETGAVSGAGERARARAEAVADVTARAQSALEALVADFPDRRKPRFIGRWFSELFNDWPEGSRPPAQATPPVPPAPRGDPRGDPR